MDELSRTLSSLGRAVTQDYIPNRHMRALDQMYNGPIPPNAKAHARRLDAQERAEREALNDPKTDAASVQGIAGPEREA